MKAIYLIFATAALSLAPRSAAAQQPAAPARPRADAAGYVGWSAANKGELGAYESWYGRSWHGGLSAGLYWTEHLKTEVEFGATSRADVYGRPFQIVTPSGQPAGNIRYEFNTRHLLLGQHYQFFHNAWFHPMLGGGLALTWEDERRQFPPVYVYDTTGRFPASRLVQPERTEGPDTRLRARAFATTGFKAYMSERAFFRSDLRLTFTRRIEDVTARFGFGVDF